MGTTLGTVQHNQLQPDYENDQLTNELHDQIVQMLFSARLISEVLPDLWQLDPAEARKRLEELRRLNRGALAEMQTLRFELKPSSLLEAELLELIPSLIEAFSAHTRIPVEFNAIGREPIPLDVKIFFYRLAQETLRSLEKTSNSTKVWIHLTREKEQAVLSIQDDGLGMHPFKGRMDKEWINLERFAQSIGVNFQAHPQPGKSTTITALWLAENESRN